MGGLYRTKLAVHRCQTPPSRAETRLLDPIRQIAAIKLGMAVAVSKMFCNFFAIFTFLYLSFCTLVLRQSNRTLLLLSRSNFSKQEFISLLESNWQNFCNNFANLMIQFQSSVIMWSSLRRDLVTTRISESTNCCSEVPKSQHFLATHCNHHIHFSRSRCQKIAA